MVSFIFSLRCGCRSGFPAGDCAIVGPEEAGRDAARLYEALSSLPGLFAPELAASGALRAAVVPLLAAMLEHGMAGAIARQG